jgi:hypothetical protein
MNVIGMRNLNRKQWPRWYSILIAAFVTGRFAIPYVVHLLRGTPRMSFGEWVCAGLLAIVTGWCLITATKEFAAVRGSVNLCDDRQPVGAVDVITI